MCEQTLVVIKSTQLKSKKERNAHILPDFTLVKRPVVLSQIIPEPPCTKTASLTAKGKCLVGRLPFNCGDKSEH